MNLKQKIVKHFRYGELIFLDKEIEELEGRLKYLKESRSAVTSEIAEDVSPFGEGEILDFRGNPLVKANVRVLKPFIYETVGKEKEYRLGLKTQPLKKDYNPDTRRRRNIDVFYNDIQMLLASQEAMDDVI